MKSRVVSASLIMMGTLLFLLACKPDPAVVVNCYNCKQDKFYGLTVEEFMKGVARYGDTHAALVNAAPFMTVDSLKASRSCWYSIDTLKKFICLIEEYSRQVDVKPEELGIRFYYAVYPANGPMHNGQNYKSLHTLFMVPTVQQKGDAVPVDFDPRYSAKYFSESGAVKSDVADSNDVKKEKYDQKQDQGKVDQKETDGKLTYIPLLKMPKTEKPLVLDLTSANAAATSGMVKNQGLLCPPTCSDATAAVLSASRSY
ncbi:hypothetical protein [Ohtaekwangia sp.]|uniref:hypothetical protein n=1 Tax=Ohtaekwangia sp. TaxID=2066019 RepID=UPI002F951E5D